MTLQLYNSDCLEQMKTIADKSIDLIICDLPYGCLSTKDIKLPEKKTIGNHGVSTLTGCSWDVKLDLDAFWKQIKRIRKSDSTPCLHFCNTKFGIDLINSNPKEFRYDLVWNKKRGVGFLSANKKPMASHEMIYVFSKKGANYNRIDIPGVPYFKKSVKEICEQNGVKRIESDNKGSRCVMSVIDLFNTAGHSGKQHPTAKPVELYKWLIERYSKEGYIILDPTFGSANSGLVCKELKRNYIGIEMNKEFYDKAYKKLHEEK